MNASNSSSASANSPASPASELAAGYALHHRAYELFGIGGAIAAALLLATHLVRVPSLLVVPFAMIVGMLAADFVSGFVHWACDTWGSPSTPILGQLAIRTFREHHVDQKAIVRHDFVETNGHNFALSIIPSVSGLIVDSPFARVCLLAMATFVALTSQIHKWAHQDMPPAMVRLLQRWRVILPAAHHSEHHAPPHTRNFCITTGWLDRPLRAVRFFETLEDVLTALTGARVARDGEPAREASPPR